ncbi:MAG: hypothetical protein ACJZ1R_07850 [Candidatus Neomarinimicrobiota bacterium]
MVRNLLLFVFISMAWSKEENRTWKDIKLIQIETNMSSIDNPIITSISDSTLTLLRGDILPYSSLNSLTTYGKVNPILPILGFYPFGVAVGSWIGLGLAFLTTGNALSSFEVLFITTLSGGFLGYKETKDYFKYKNKKYQLIKDWSNDKKKAFFESFDK